MPNAVRRVGGTSGPTQTYTLGAHEAFRLDAVSFRLTWAEEGSYVIPALVAASSGGATIAEIAAPAQQISAPPPGQIGFSGPAVMTNDVDDAVPDGSLGYLLHDFGAVPVTSQITLTWTQPPGLQAWAAELWLRSAGAVSMGPVIGTDTVTDTSTITVTLTSGIAAGHYLFLRPAWISPENWINPTVAQRPTVTDSVGGNVVDYSGIPLGGFAVVALQRPDGQYLNSACFFYRIVNPLAAGDTVTVSFPTGQRNWLTLNTHDITGLTVGNPIGPIAGGNYTQIGQAPSVSPFTSVAAPTPKWVGGVIVNDGYLIAAGGTLDVMMARGGVEIQAAGNFALAGSAKYLQLGLPELHLIEQDTLTATSIDTLAPREGDTISNFLVWGIDE